MYIKQASQLTDTKATKGTLCPLLKLARLDAPTLAAERKVL